MLEPVQPPPRMLHHTKSARLTANKLKPRYQIQNQCSLLKTYGLISIEITTLASIRTITVLYRMPAHRKGKQPTKIPIFKNTTLQVSSIVICRRRGCRGPNVKGNAPIINGTWTHPPTIIAPHRACSIPVAQLYSMSQKLV